MAITQQLQFRVDAVTGGFHVVSGDSLSSSKMFNLRNVEILSGMDEKKARNYERPLKFYTGTLFFRGGRLS